MQNQVTCCDNWSKIYSRFNAFTLHCRGRWFGFCLNRKRREGKKKKKILNAAFTFTLYCHNITVAHAPTCTCGCSRCSNGYRQARMTQFTPLYCQYKIRPAAQTVLIKLFHTYTRHIQHNRGGGGGGVCLFVTLTGCHWYRWCFLWTEKWRSAWGRGGGRCTVRLECNYAGKNGYKVFVFNTYTPMGLTGRMQMATNQTRTSSCLMCPPTLTDKWDSTHLKQTMCAIHRGNRTSKTAWIKYLNKLRKKKKLPVPQTEQT